jgi:hypothetical protein
MGKRKGWTLMNVFPLRKIWAIMSIMNSTGSRSTAVRMSKFEELQKAAEDFRYLLNRGYPRKAALELVGNRYGLTSDERHLLHRGIFSDADSKSRRKRKIPIGKVRNRDLAIDGYNVIITIEAGLSGQPLILGDDGFIRDISGLSGNFKKTERTEEALQLILDIVKRVKPRKTLFLFDSPISMSGELAQEVRDLLKKENLLGDARAVKVPEKILIGFPGVIATSDTAIIDQSKEVVDLAGDIIRKRIGLKSLLRWKRKSLGG